jgi:cysteinyl-tRNA synthetase
MKAALEDDLNTAQAQAAIFEMVRSVNAALDANGIKQDDVPALLRALEQFDEIFAVLNDDDAAKMKQVFEWAPAEGRAEDVSRELREAVQSGQLSDAEIEKKVAEMEAARRSRNFTISDILRTELTGAGIVIENTKDGVRWRRK